MGGLVRGQWVDNELEMIWGLIGNVWVECRVMTSVYGFMARG